MKTSEILESKKESYVHKSKNIGVSKSTSQLIQHIQVNLAVNSMSFPSQLRS